MARASGLEAVEASGVDELSLQALASSAMISALRIDARVPGSGYANNQRPYLAKAVCTVENSTPAGTADGGAVL